MKPGTVYDTTPLMTFMLAVPFGIRDADEVVVVVACREEEASRGTGWGSGQNNNLRRFSARREVIGGKRAVHANAFAALLHHTSDSTIASVSLHFSP